MCKKKQMLFEELQEKCEKAKFEVQYEKYFLVLLFEAQRNRDYNRYSWFTSKRL